LGKLPELGQ
jgi:hypothetical protein